MDELKEVKKRYMQFRERTLAAGGVDEMSFTLKNGVNLVVRKADGAEPKELRNIADTIAQKYQKAVVLVSCDKDGKRAFVVKTVGKFEHIDAVTVAKQIAADLNGRAGGRADFAQGGGEAKRPWQALVTGLKDTL